MLNPCKQNPAGPTELCAAATLSLLRKVSLETALQQRWELCSPGAAACAAARAAAAAAPPPGIALAPLALAQLAQRGRVELGRRALGLVARPVLREAWHERAQAPQQPCRQLRLPVSILSMQQAETLC